MAGLVACTIVVDRSMNAVEAGDFTLAISACSSVPNGGFDACRFKEGAPIQSSWITYLPYGGKVLGGEATVMYQGIEKVYSIVEDQKEIVIPWQDFFTDNVWKTQYSGVASMRIDLRILDNNDVEKTIPAVGEARIFVLSSGYSVLPVDSGYAAWEREITCKLSYTTSGRSNVTCK